METSCLCLHTLLHLNPLACHLYYLNLDRPARSWFCFALCSLFSVQCLGTGRALCVANSGDMPFQPTFVTFSALETTLGRQMAPSTAEVALLFLCCSRFHTVNGRIPFKLVCVTLHGIHALRNLHGLLQGEVRLGQPMLLRDLDVCQTRSVWRVSAVPLHILLLFLQQPAPCNGHSLWLVVSLERGKLVL